MRPFTLQHPAELEVLESGNRSDADDADTSRQGTGRQLPRQLLASTTFFGLAVAALFAMTCWQQQNLATPKTVGSMQVMQKDDLDNLRKSLLGDDDAGGDDEDNGKTKHGKTNVVKSGQKLLGKFSKCGGGVDWTGSTCCKKGCACIIKSMFFSMCQTPKGAQDCDELAAKDEVRRAIIRAKIAPGNIGRFKKMAKEAASKLGGLKKLEARDKKRVAKIRPIGNKIKAKKDSIVKKAKQARAKADQTRKDAAVHGKLLWRTKHENKKLLAKKDVNSKAYWKVKGKVEALKKQTDTLTAAINVTEKEAVKLEAEAKKIVAKANKIGTLRAHLEKQANKSAEKRKQYEEHATDLAAKAARAEKAVKYEAANVNVWRKVAKGDTCSDLIASHVHEAPIVDFGGDDVSDEEAARAQKREQDAEKNWKKKGKRLHY
mmetsp:Transcript_79325/g.157128  ORF Transcript_79325/g.157128 Transcript_79325/m.157128 type:complete len:431 (+) Transcript_79325:107-1399(+)|eukprot:CAMPEP_0172714940 /NCGR_PEP_ID=MMETSP1074-20121228/67259_1 /TAXON_ID=2916 /ORGANISM="Ceratium fusus, Strain PA161109" /LENGTH=430 /DNA_ID=CAMNT_0013539469 /DNA_START=64 /DNA_END=1359 /DNA_ORIENTATION=-